MNFSKVLSGILLLGVLTAPAAEVLTPKGGEQGCPLPDGKVLYVEEDDEGELRLVLEKKPLTAGAMPRLSPDGRFAAFAVGWIEPEVKFLKLDTLEIIEPPAPVKPEESAFFWVGKALLWRENGKTLAFRPDLKAMEKAPAEFPEHTLTVSPDGKKYVVKDGRAFLVMNLDGKALAKIELPPGTSTEGGRLRSPVFSPDGKKIAYVSETIRPLADIMLMDLSSGKVEAITRDHLDHQYPAFSPDGKSIVFSGLRGESTVLYRETLPPEAKEK